MSKIDLFKSCLSKQEELKKIFAHCKTPESKYQKIIELGKSLPPLRKEAYISENIVSGCQSIVYLHAYLQEGKMQFEAFSESLISAGLVALLIFIYHEEAPETVLKCPPQCIEDLGISASLSPNRAHGLGNIYLKMKQEALHYLLKQNKGLK